MPPANLSEPPPRVLLIVPDQWPRALLRAQLRESGYDAIGARDLADAMVHPVAAAERGPVRLLLVDREALSDPDGEPAAELLARHPGAAAVLLIGSAEPAPPGSWRRLIRRPVSIAEIVGVVRDLIPLPQGSRRPLD